MITYSEKPAKWIQRPGPYCGRHKTLGVSRRTVEPDDLPVYGCGVILERTWLLESKRGPARILIAAILGAHTRLNGGIPMTQRPSRERHRRL